LGVILEEIDMYDDSPEDLVHELLQKNVWENHALGYIISGEKSVVSAMTREQIVDYMKLHYCGSNMVISIAGNFEEQEVISNLNRYFAVIPRFGTGKNANTDADTVPQFTRCLCERKKDVEQLYMNLAFPTMDERDEERHVQIMANALLGGSNNSYLFQQVREELGLAYSVYSYSSLYRYAGLFHIDVIVNPSNAVKVYDKLTEILKKFSANIISNEELNSLYTQMRIEMIMGSESARNRMERNAKAMLMHGRIVTLDETLDKLSMVSAEDIRMFGEKYLDLSKAGICLVGELSKEAEKVKKNWR
jgi:predicted Zn-dependent peptidase